MSKTKTCEVCMLDALVSRWKGCNDECPNCLAQAEAEEEDRKFEDWMEFNDEESRWRALWRILGKPEY